MVTRRGLFLGTASLAAAGVLLRPRAALAAPSDFNAQIDALEKRAARLGIVQPGARSLDDTADEFSDARERLLDMIDASEGKGPEGRSLGEDAGEVLARLTAEEAQTPKGSPENDPLYNSARIQRKFKFDEVTREEYRELYARCVIRDDKRGLIARDVRRLLTDPRTAAYKDVEARTGVPWYFIGALHGLEASFNLTRHLHNGDSLTAQTWQVPAGRPKVWDPPNDWASSAEDALAYEGFTSASAKRRGWSLEAMLYRFERYNGVGPRRRYAEQQRSAPSQPHQYTAYLWSYSNHYTNGKYVADGVWDPAAVSKQCGTVVLIKALVEKGAIEPPRLYDQT